MSFGIFARPLALQSVFKKEPYETTKHFIIEKSVVEFSEFQRCRRENPTVLCPTPGYEAGKMV